MTLSEIRALGNLPVLALTLWGEARGEAIEGKVAVGSVIRNRLTLPARFGKTYADVCLAPFQFSCWLDAGGGANHAALLALAQSLEAGVGIADRAFRECWWVASGIISGELQDRARQANHYVTHALYNGVQAPAWVRRARVVANVGSHIFMIA